MKTNDRTLVLIPAHNEEASLPDIIDEIRSVMHSPDILVVDDASGDNTRGVAEERGVMVLSLPFNLGIAGARQAGYKFAHEAGYDFLIQFDADGQHDPSYAVKLLDNVKSGTSDLAIGSRFIGDSGYKVPVSRRIGIGFLARIISFLTRKNITDPTSGFHAINKKVLALYAEHYPYEYPEPEEIILLHRMGYKVSDVRVAMRQRRQGKSFLTPLVSVYYMFEVTLAVIMAFIRRYPTDRDNQ